MDQIETEFGDSPPPEAPAEETSSKRGQDDDQDPSSKKSVTRKRTKTGCMTCRKRRIKCDERRPTCKKCEKSKRVCEGYVQRVIFKDPLGSYSSQYGHPLYAPRPPRPQPPPQNMIRDQQLTVTTGSASRSLQFIAPRPPYVYFPQGTPPFGEPFLGLSHGLPSPPANLEPHVQNHDVERRPSGGPLAYDHTDYSLHALDIFPQNIWTQDQSSLERHNDYTQLVPPTDAPHESILSSVAAQYIRNDLPLLEDELGDHSQNEPALVQNELGQPDQPSQLIEQLGYESVPEDDMRSVESEDESAPENENLYGSTSQFEFILAHRALERFEPLAGAPRMFNFHPLDETLTMYEPSAADTPLLNDKIASVFWHFVSVTGSSMSLQERNPFDGTLHHSWSGANERVSRQHLWNYVFPVISLNHPALLQAILAIASLQIANLQGVPPTASLKHYHLALRRVARNIGMPSKRTQPANLAATMLLAYYEVWNSDHEKWVKHLLGAHWIMKDIAFADMTRGMMRIKLRTRLKKERIRQELEHAALDPFGVGSSSTFRGLDPQSYDTNLVDEDPLYEDWDDINVPLLRTLTGKRITYDQFGIGSENSGEYLRAPDLSSKDIDTYEQLSDLFWWYCKMDIYQSFLGATRLVMSYDQWTQCPPRAPVGRLDASYGTSDHVMLLMGRVADFASRDLARKRLKLSKGGAHGPPGGSDGPFPGIVPRRDHLTIPMGFSPPQEDCASPRSEASEEEDLEVLTMLAMREWEDISNAFKALRDQFGPAFDPLGPDVQKSINTPFGPTRHYRTYTIAGTWMNYFMGLIVLHRAHPDMPPFAMVAAGASYQSTEGYANEIARIAYGLEENLSQLVEVSTLISAALIESGMPLFVAGVQFRPEPQRHWLIQFLRNVSRLTGWQSAHQISRGLESGWTRAAETGRGPPYRPAPDVDVTASTKWNNQTRDALYYLRGPQRRIDELISETGPDEGTGEGHYVPVTHHSKIRIAKPGRAHYALGILSLQEDLDRLELEEKDEKEAGSSADAGGHPSADAE